MAIVKTEVIEYIKAQLKMAGIAEVQADSYAPTAMYLGGALFWREDWYFARREKNITVSSGTSEYLADSKLEAGVDGIYGMQRLSSSDYGFDMRERTPEGFERGFPYPTSRDNGSPTYYNLYYKDGKLYFAVFPAPDSSYTVRVSYRLGWHEDRLGSIPDNFVDVYMEACLVYAMPLPQRNAQKLIYQGVVDGALQNNSPSRKKAPNVDEPTHLVALSEADIALERGYTGEDY